MIFNNSGDKLVFKFEIGLPDGNKLNIKGDVSLKKKREPVAIRSDSKVQQGNPKPLNILMDRYLKECLDLDPEDARNRGATSIAYARYSKSAKEILEYSNNDLDLAWRGVREIGQKMQSRNLTWNLATVAKWFLDWKVDAEKPQRDKEGAF